MEITIPHKFNPRPYQLPFLKAMDNGCKRAIKVWNRRSGKDKTDFNFMIKEAVKIVGTYFYFLPTYAQAKKVVWDNIDNDGFKMLDHIPKALIAKTNATELKVELINGSIIQLMGADEFEKSGVGTNPKGVVFSEYSLTSPTAWKFVAPILAANGGWAVFNFTPRGMNHAWTLLQMAKDNEKWFYEILTNNETHILTDEEMEEERRNNPADIIEQEWYCKFIDGAGSFFKRINDNLYDGLNERPDPKHRYQIGVDLAKFQDYTVITVVDLMTFKIVEQDRFNQIDWNLQKAKIEAMYLRYYKPLIVMDSTGVGSPIYDDLSRIGLNILPYTFTEGSRRDLLTNLQLLLEQDKIKIPEHLSYLIDELKSFKYVLTESGKIKIQVPDGVHDDTVFSLALACWQLPNNPLPIYGTIRFMNKYSEDNKQTSYE